MATLVLNAISSAYPLITQRIRASVFTQQSPNAIVRQEIDNTPGHPSRIWSFNGLRRVPYGFSLDVIDADGNVIKNLVYFAVVPGQVDGFLSRSDEQIRVGVTIGLNAGASVANFDGTDESPDYRGWDIVVSELTGRGILDEDIDFTWESELGIFTLLQEDDLFQPYQSYNIHFNPINQTAANTPLEDRDYVIEDIKESIILEFGAGGKKFIVTPNPDYIEITLPDAENIVEGRPVSFIVEKEEQCSVKFITQRGQEISFLDGDIYAVSGERITFFARKVLGVFKWFVSEAEGNFDSVGETFFSDKLPAFVKKGLPLEGQLVSKEKYARLYNKVALVSPSTMDTYNWNTYASLRSPRLPQVFSLDDGNGYFRVPDRRELYETSPIVQTLRGGYRASENKSHNHKLNGDSTATSAGSGGIMVGNPAGYESINESNNGKLTVEFSGAQVGRPETILLDKYITI